MNVEDHIELQALGYVRGKSRSGLELATIRP